MTCFARHSLPARQGGWAVEIRSLNHRYFEFSLKIPPALSSLENQVRDAVQAQIKRGKITVAVSQELPEGEAKHLAVDESAVAFYASAVKKLKMKFKLQGEMTVSDLLRLPGIFSGPENGADPEKAWPGLKKALAETLAGALKAKETEGGKLAKDMEARLAAVAKAVGQIEEYSRGQAERIFKRLSERVAALTEEGPKDPERMSREVAFLAERSDITEEVVRMRSHLELFKKKLRGSGETGRELDFLCQEMNREINTMGSKSQFFEISTQVVFVKGELEKIREQVQNIE